MKIVLPDEVGVIRRVEALLVSALQELGFEEVLLPRLLLEEDWLRVVNCLGGASNKLLRETFRVKSADGSRHVLCHWQCEPFYLAMQTHQGRIPPRVFDRSGWSFRDEESTRGLHFRQFQRVEAIWFGMADEVRAVGDHCQEALADILDGLGIPTEVRLREGEATASTQREVRDLVYRGRRSEIELVGMHFHGPAFIDTFLRSAAAGMESGCLGISLSRIATLLLHHDSGDPPERHPC